MPDAAEIADMIVARYIRSDKIYRARTDSSISAEVTAATILDVRRLTSVAVWQFLMTPVPVACICARLKKARTWPDCEARVKYLSAAL